MGSYITRGFGGIIPPRSFQSTKSTVSGVSDTTLSLVGETSLGDGAFLDDEAPYNDRASDDDAASYDGGAPSEDENSMGYTRKQPKRTRR